MTAALCLASFAAGIAVHWAATRVQVRKRESDVRALVSDVLDLVEAQRAADGDLATAIRRGEGAQ